jgi:hypothetical protein
VRRCDSGGAEAKKSRPDHIVNFAEDVELAELQAKDGMLQKLLRDKDPKWTWNILKNRYPHEFQERIATEVSGPDGGLIPGTTNPFVVQVQGIEPPPGFWESFVPDAEREGIFGRKPPLNGG